ncbi:MAG: hypothetical protein EBX36_10700 [Planctomycetia bacterium]|nr:hypothetical protein [Planctomycetia bacterium]
MPVSLATVSRKPPMRANVSAGTSMPAISADFSAIMYQPVTDMSPALPGSYRQPPLGPWAATQ